MRAREGGGVRPAATVALRPSDAPLGKGKARTLRAVPAGGAQSAVRRGSGGLGTTTTSLHSTAEKVSSRKPVCSRSNRYTACSCNTAPSRSDRARALTLDVVVLHIYPGIRLL